MYKKTLNTLINSETRYNKDCLSNILMLIIEEY